MQWYKSVWNSFSLPKHRMIEWLAVQNRLKTKVRLRLMNISNDDTSVVCGLFLETKERLMFSYHYRQQCMNRLMEWLQVPWRSRGLIKLCI